MTNLKYIVTYLHHNTQMKDGRYCSYLELFDSFEETHNNQFKKTGNFSLSIKQGTIKRLTYCRRVLTYWAVAEDITCKVRHYVNKEEVIKSLQEVLLCTRKTSASKGECSMRSQMRRNGQDDKAYRQSVDFSCKCLMCRIFSGKIHICTF